MNINFLAIETVINAIRNIKAGTFHSFTYATVKPAVDGGEVIKVWKCLARVKINGKHMEGYVPSENPKTFNSDNKMIVKHCITEYAKTGNINARIYPVWSKSKKKATYIHKAVDGVMTEVTKADAIALYAKAPKANAGDPPKSLTVNCKYFLEV